MHFKSCSIYKVNAFQEDPPDVQLSKFLSYVCRHGAEKEGIRVHDGGFINVEDVLSKSRVPYSKEDVQRVVRQCQKQRFALRNDPATGYLQIRANQGHTLKVRSRCTCRYFAVRTKGGEAISR